MLEGELQSIATSDTVYALKPGDTLFFDADAPHGPEVLEKASLPGNLFYHRSYPRNALNISVAAGVRCRDPPHIPGVMWVRNRHRSATGSQGSSGALSIKPL